MITIARFNDLGRYTAVLSASQDSIDMEDQARIYVGEVNPLTQCHDMATGLPVNLPARPSEHHSFNWQTKQWEDPRTLQDLKDAQWALIKQARSNAEYAGFTWDGSTFDSDATSQNRITGAVALAQTAISFGQPFTIDWVLANNTVRTLDGMAMLQAGLALGAHVSAQFSKGLLLREAIEAATSQVEVEAVVW